MDSEFTPDAQTVVPDALSAPDEPTPLRPGVVVPASAAAFPDVLSDEDQALVAAANQQLAAAQERLQAAQNAFAEAQNTVALLSIAQNAVIAHVTQTYGLKEGDGIQPNGKVRRK